MADPERTVKVVIAEDDPVVALLVCTWVEELGYEAIQCTDGKLALKALEENTDCDLLITDVIMPRMDGRDLVRELRSRESYKHLPIIIISAFVGDEGISELLNNEATCFIEKPMDAKKLIACMKHLIEHGKCPAA